MIILNCKKKFIVFFIGTLHFILSFLNKDVGLYLLGDYNWNLSIPINTSISNSFETFILLLLGSLFLFFDLIIFYFLIYKLLINGFTKYKYFLILFFATLTILLFLWPDNLSMDIDNYVCFGYSFRVIPMYWHSIFTTAFYVGALMFFPHPLSVCVIQLIISLSIFIYIYNNLQPNKNSKCLLLALSFIIILPYTFELLYNPLRISLYTLLVIYYISYLHLNSNLKSNLFEILKFSLMSALVCVWRSEGIIFGFPLIILFLLQLKSKNFFKFKLLLLSLLFMFIFKQCQNIGEIKYYGNDYTLLNIFNPVKNILNDKECNLNYSDSNIDLNNIDKITPLNIIKEYGMDGYRSYNQNLGRMDFNQSGLDTNTTKQAINSAYNLYLHNPHLYLKTQINYLFLAFKIPLMFTEPAYTGVHQEIKTFNFNLWKVEKNNMFMKFKINKWNDFEVRKFISKGLTKLHNLHIKLFSPFSILIFLSLIIVNVYFSYSFLNSLVLKKKLNLFGSISIALLLLLTGVFMFMPAGRINYLYSFYFGSLTNFLFFVRSCQSFYYKVL